jgi:hypothetical protein
MGFSLMDTILILSIFTHKRYLLYSTTIIESFLQFLQLSKYASDIPAAFAFIPARRFSPADIGGQVRNLTHYYSDTIFTHWNWWVYLSPAVVHQPSVEYLRKVFHPPQAESRL